MACQRHDSILSYTCTTRAGVFNTQCTNINRQFYTINYNRSLLLYCLGSYCTYETTKFIANHSKQQQNSNKTCKMIINTAQNGDKHCIKLLVHVKISVGISVQFQKIPISDITNFVISAADILPIRNICTPLIMLQILKCSHKAFCTFPWKVT